ncbi:GTP-binding protein [Streptomyces sp. NPDC002537]
MEYIGEPGTGVRTLIRAVARATGHDEPRETRSTPFDWPDYTTGAMKLVWALPHDIVLVISAVDGVTSATRELVGLARQVGVRQVAVFVNKADLLPDTELRQVVELEIRGLLKEHGYPGDATPVVFGSSLNSLTGAQDRAVESLLTALKTSFEAPRSPLAQPFLLLVEDVFALRDGRTVLTGKVERGAVLPGDELELVGPGGTRTVTVTTIEQFRASLGHAKAGDNIGMELRGMDRREDAGRGHVLAKPGSIAPHTEFEAVLYIRPEEQVGKPIVFPSTREGRFMFRTAERLGSIPALRAGGVDLHWSRAGLATATVRLTEPVPLEEKQRFLMRDRTGSGVAEGVITRIVT